MKKMLQWFLIFWVVASLSSLPAFAISAEEQACHILLQYSANGTGFSGLDIRIYRFAEWENEEQYHWLP